jgi:LacI family transcriptional regulator
MIDQAGRELLGRPGRPTAIFAGADFAALGVLRAAYELGLRIPADLPRVDQAARDLGAAAARLLCERMDGGSRSVLTSTAPQLIVRATTGPPPP